MVTIRDPVNLNGPKGVSQMNRFDPPLIAVDQIPREREVAMFLCEKYLREQRWYNGIL